MLIGWKKPSKYGGIRYTCTDCNRTLTGTRFHRVQYLGSLGLCLRCHKNGGVVPSVEVVPPSAERFPEFPEDAELFQTTGYGSLSILCIRCQRVKRGPTCAVITSERKGICYHCSTDNEKIFALQLPRGTPASERPGNQCVNCLKLRLETEEYHPHPVSRMMLCGICYQSAFIEYTLKKAKSQGETSERG